MNFSKVLTEMKVPSTFHKDAIESIERAKQLNKKVSFYKWAAFIVVPFITRSLKWEDESLPEKWSKFDNEISINGDNWDWKDLGNDQFVRLPVPLEDTPEVRERNYWNKGKHQRDNSSRRAFLLRNRASKYACDLGAKINPVERQLFGDEDISVKRPGIFVMESGGLWQIRRIRKYGPFAIVENYGYKVNNAWVNRQLINPINASVTYIPFSIKRSK